MATYINGGFLQVFNSSNDFASGGTVETYIAGTSTHRTTYPTLSDAIAETNANSWPITLDARGEAVAAINGPTDIIIKDSAGTILVEVDGLDQLLSDVLDENGNILLHYAPVASAVNYFTIANSTTGSAVVLGVDGADTNIPISITSKGNLPLYLNGGATGQVIINNNSTGGIVATRALTASSTLAVAGAATLSSNATVGGTLAVTGTSTLTGNVTAAGTLQVTGDTAIGGSLNLVGTLATSVGSAISFLPAGSIIMWATVSAPNGWLLANGAAVSRTTYAALFALLGTAYGAGDGSTTFNLPNFESRFPVGAGGTYGLATTGGSTTATLNTGNLPSSAITGTINVIGTAAGAQTTVSTTGLANSGVATPVNILPPYYAMNFIIKAF